MHSAAPRPPEAMLLTLRTLCCTLRTFLRKRLAFLAAATAALLISACGFQLRGNFSLPYESLFIDMPDTSVVGAGLKRQIRSGTTTRVADAREDAQATFIQVTDLRERQILSLATSGRVREVRLRLRYAYRIVDTKGRELIPTTGLEITRDLTYDDSAVLSKEQEEIVLWRDMENDLIQQLMRRLSAVKPKPPQENIR